MLRVHIKQLIKSSRGMKTNHTSALTSEPYGTKYEPFDRRIKASGRAFYR